MSHESWALSQQVRSAVFLKDRWRFPLNPKVRKFRLVHQMERTILVCSARNIRDQLWGWSTMIGLVISVGRTEMPFPFAKLLSPVPLFSILLTRTSSAIESEVLWVKHDISNSLNQLQFFSIFDICHWQCQITDATGQIGENKYG